MATLRQIKDKKHSVLTINKITKAMKLVSTAKSQKAIKNKNIYDNYFNKVLKTIAEISDDKKEEKKYLGTYWILVMSDLGLAGGYNNIVLKELKKNLKPQDRILILGMKGMGLKKELSDKVEITDLSAFGHSNKLSELIVRIKHMYYDEQYDIKAVYTEYKSQIDFEPAIKQILPIPELDESLKEEEKSLAVTIFEPEKSLLLKELENIYIHSYLVKIFKETQASEHTSRKNAMDNATKNGEEMLEKLDIEYNRGRQAKITQEISEIIGGAESLK